MPTALPRLPLTESDESQLRQWLSAFGTPQQIVLRSRIVLAVAAGESDNSIAQQLDTNRKTVTLWRNRYADQGLHHTLEKGSNTLSSYIVDTTLVPPGWLLGRHTGDPLLSELRRTRRSSPKAPTRPLPPQPYA
jgi:hypothetical protein